MRNFDKEKMTFVLDSNDEFYEIVYNNKGNPVRVQIYERVGEKRLSKQPIGYVDLEYEDWNQLDSCSYIGGDESEYLVKEYEVFYQKLINKLETEDSFKFYV